MFLLPMASAAPGEAEGVEKLYATRCQPCHGAGGKAANPDMNLADDRWIHGSSLEDMVRVIENGVPGKAMLPFKELLGKDEIVELARYVQSFGKKTRKAKGAKP